MYGKLKFLHTWMFHRDGTHLLQEQAERVGAVEPEEEMAPGRLGSGTAVSKGWL